MTTTAQQPELPADGTSEAPATLPVGIHDQVEAAAYHEDPCAPPSLSAHIAATLCNRSPRHAFERHPRLNPDHERIDEQKYDIGTAAHALLLCGDDIVSVVDAADWRTKAAKAAADGARAEGMIPLLAKDAERVRAMVAAVRDQLAAFTCDPPLLTDGKPEQTLVWEDGGVMCRARLDWLRDDRAAVDDLKTTAGSADPAEWARRRMFDIGADVQAAFYLRAVKALTRVDAQFRFVICETAPPYAVSVVSLAPSALELANDKVAYALDSWRRCLRTGEWPAYPTEIAYAAAPPWHLEQWLEARELEEARSA